MYTASGLITHAQQALARGAKYLFGCALKPLTLAELDRLHSEYPQYVTDARYQIARSQYIGQICTDCSGLVYSYFPKYRQTDQMYNGAKTRNRLDKNNVVGVVPPGAVLWRDGHVGIYIGNGMEIEARGFDYGMQKRKVSDTTFTHWLTFDGMLYDAKEGGGSLLLPIAAIALLTYLILRNND